MTTELGLILAALLGSGGLAGLLLKRWWGQQDNATDAYRDGVVEGEKRCSEQLTEIRAQATADRVQCNADLKRLRDALVAIVQHPMTDPVVRTEVFRVLWGPSDPPVSSTVN